MKQLHSFTEVDGVLAKFVPKARQFRSVYTLDNMQNLMQALGNPQESYRVVHIAGTSGKTSTAYYTAGLLQQSGKRVGLTVSPHVDTVNERVQIDLESINEVQYCQLFSRFMQLVEDSGVQPTYFELLVSFAYWAFAEMKVDYAVVEVGLGGLLDGTNVISRSDKVSVLTDIGLDHVDILGNDIAGIAAQKAGIILPDSDVFCLEQDTEILEVFRSNAAQKNARLHEIEYEVSSHASHLPLFQQRNWWLAYNAASFVTDRDGLSPLSDEQLEASTHVHIPARMEILQRNNATIVLDTAHNPQKMQALIGSLKDRFPEQKFAVLLALLRSKDMRVQGVLEQLLPVTSHLIVTDFIAGQDLRKHSTPPKDIVAACAEIGFKRVEIIADTTQAYRALQQRSETHKLVTGSFYLLHDMHKLLGKL
ncbi:hypothetical protein EKI60_00895 [Candidatus Saccharibacteria bacterium]|nr:MAG: hypothetical protein EKI60_00895 [Candidatus Saccharibacteria bacterium]